MMEAKNEKQDELQYYARNVVMATFLTILIISFFPSAILLSVETEQAILPGSKELTNEELSNNFAKIRNNIILIVGLVGTPFLVWRTWLASQQTKTAQQQAETARDRSYTELFTKAVEQLGAEKPAIEILTYKDNDPITDKAGRPLTQDTYVPNIEVRIGAIFALERIMKDSEKDASAIADTLAAYVRENCGKPTLECEIPKKDEGQSIDDWVQAIKNYVGYTWAPDDGTLLARARALQERPEVNPADIKTALTVLGKRLLHLKDPEHFKNEEETKLPDLRAVNFQGWDLADFDLTHCNLSDAQMQGANLKGAKMQGADLSHAKMQEVQITSARKTTASVIWVDFTKTSFDFDELQSQLPEMFGHKTQTTLPEGMALPDHWSEADLDILEGRQQYVREWKAFKSEKGVE